MLRDIHSHHIGQEDSEKLVSCSMPGIGHDEWKWEHARYVSLSLHPWYVTSDNLTLQLDWILQHAHHPKVLAIGEAGLDKLCTTPFELQQKAFREAIAISEQSQLPLIIHCVKAYNEIIHLRKEISPRQPWIIHGFRGKKQLMEMLLNHGLYLSFGERYQTQSLQHMPADRLFIETDESSIPVTDLYCKAANLMGTNVDDLTNNIEKNIKQLFLRR